MALSSAELKLNRLGIMDKIESILKKANATFRLPAPAQALAKGSGNMSLRGFKSNLTIVNGGYQMQKPVAAQTALGPVTLKGGGNLAGQLNADMSLELKPSLLGLAGTTAVPLSFHIGGSHNRPTLSGFNAKKLLAAVALGGAAKILGDTGVLDKVGIDAGQIPTSLGDAKAKAQDEVKKQVTGLKRKATKKVQDTKIEVTKRAKAEADKAKARAKAEVDKAKKKAKDTAKKKTKEAAGKLLDKLKL